MRNNIRSYVAAGALYYRKDHPFSHLQFTSSDSSFADVIEIPPELEAGDEKSKIITRFFRRRSVYFKYFRAINSKSCTGGNPLNRPHSSAVPLQRYQTPDSAPPWPAVSRQPPIKQDRIEDEHDTVDEVQRTQAHLVSDRDRLQSYRHEIDQLQRQVDRDT